MKTIFKFLFPVLAALIVASCQKPSPDNGDDPKQESGLNEKISFTIDIAEVNVTSASIKVSHNGEDTDSWYAFATETSASTVSSLIEEKVNELKANGKVSGLKKQTSYTYSLSDLKAETAYTFIAFGLTEDGTIYGKAVSKNFTTKKAELQMKENSAWKITYSGKASIEGKEYDHTVSVTTSDSNPYFITYTSKAYLEQTDIKTFAQEQLASLKEYAEYAGSKLSDFCSNQSGMGAINISVGEWYAIALGVEDNELSGLYAISELITIEEQEATEAYSAWIGNWEWTGANGISVDVTFSKGINNEYYLMSGWEGMPAEGGLDIPVYWDPSNELWYIMTTNFGEFDFGTAGTASVWLLGGIGESIYPNEELPICFGGFDENNNRVVIPYSEEGEDGSTIAIEWMQYGAKFTDGWSYISSTFEIGYPRFPISVKESTAPVPATKAGMTLAAYPSNLVELVNL